MTAWIDFYLASLMLRISLNISTTSYMVIVLATKFEGALNDGDKYKE